VAELWAEILLYMPALLRGAVWTLALAACSAVGAVSVGLLVCGARMSGVTLFSAPARGFISLIRGTPLLLQIFYIYYGLPELGIVMPAFVAGVLALSLNFGGYLAELFRGGIQSVDPGQRQAAMALGLGRLQAFALVVAPQAFRTILPALGNYATVLVKETSLVATISVLELMRTGELLASATFRVLLIYSLVALIYYTICTLIARLFVTAERRAAIPGSLAAELMGGSKDAILSRSLSTRSAAPAKSP
jgi:His/Glu/Gln/Arg/opine family amino acid ABC transporter permease subunit